MGGRFRFLQYTEPCFPSGKILIFYWQKFNSLKSITKAAKSTINLLSVKTNWLSFAFALVTRDPSPVI